MGEDTEDVRITGPYEQSPSTSHELVPRETDSVEDEEPPAPARRFGGSIVRFGILLLLVFAVAVAGVSFAVIKVWPHFANPVTARTTDRSQPPLLKSIQDLSRYVAAEGTFQEVVDLQHDRKFIPDFLVNDRTLFVATATVEVYVDFTTIGQGAVKPSPDHKAVEIDLPAPAVGKPNIDHAKSYVVAEQQGALNRLGDIFGSDPNKQQEVYLKAEQQIAAAATTSGLADRAQVNTRNMLQSMLRSLGYNQVTINFAKA